MAVFYSFGLLAVTTCGLHFNNLLSFWAHLYVHLVPGNASKDGKLGPLNVEAEVVDGGIAQGQED